MIEIAARCTEARQTDKAAQVLSQALDVARIIEDASRKASTLAEIASKYAEAGQFSQALEIVKAIEVAEGKA